MRIADNVLGVLDRADIDGNALRITDGQLDAKLYVAVAKVLTAAGGRWNRSAKAHLFAGNAADAIEPVILTGEVVSRKQITQFFPTPPAIVARVLLAAQIEKGMEVLEPSAGEGAIAGPVAAMGADVDVIEYDLGFAATLAAAGFARAMLVADFLAVDPIANYDRVVMNPPFTKQADIAHVEHALGFLKPGGRLVAVMAAGVTFREGKAARFRDLVESRGGRIEPLPQNSFRTSGTDINTVLVTIPAAA
jgi:predicted RNA methylase